MLTSQQLQTLKTDLAGNTNTVTVGGVSTAIKDVPRNGDTAFAVAAWYGQAANPAFVVWRTNISKDEVNNAVDWTEVVALTTNNLLAFGLLKDQNKIDGSDSDIRAAFNAIFPTATKPNTNAALLALAKRSASNVEKLFATGTGTTAAPATMGYEGQVTGQDVVSAWNS
jgi:hypothetical protein